MSGLGLKKKTKSKEPLESRETRMLRLLDLLEVGFEYVCEKDDLMFLRKRK